MYDYSDRESKKTWNQILDKIDIVFTATFALEAILKIIAMGFIIHKFAYLRQGWNVIDFFIAIAG
jgi:Ion transport protein